MAEEAPMIQIQEEIMFYDTDCGGVVHNIAWLRLIEKARTMLAAKMGMDLREMARTQLYPVVVRTEIDYRKPAALGDTIEIRGALEKLQGARFWVQFEITLLGSPTVLIECRQALALVQMPEGTPRRLPADWKFRFGHLGNSM